MLTYLASLHNIAPVAGWENVPGVCLQQRTGFWSFLGALGNRVWVFLRVLTLSSSEFHKDAAVCSLLDILETGDVPQRFYLSATACKGILLRAEKRGKKLPTPLTVGAHQYSGFNGRASSSKMPDC